MDTPQVTTDGAQGRTTKQQLWERKLLDFSLRNNLLNRRLGKRVIRLATFDMDQIEDRIR